MATTYPGANAQVLADTVASPIAQQVNGVEGMLYMSSVSASDGSYRLTVTFDVGTDLDIAQVLVQNRVATAEPLLPQEVQQQGITTRKQSTDIILFVVLTSPDGCYDDLYLSNYARMEGGAKANEEAPVFYVVVQGVSERWAARRGTPAVAAKIT